ncbi:hypothetical protein Dimus_036538 [Dionaea muscipula]
MEEKGLEQTNCYVADLSSIKEARERIHSVIHKTPVLSSEALNSMVGRKLLFKCECFQKGGAFKFRGASNAVFSLNDEEAAKGVVTHSSGNHAAALALAAKLRGIPAYIVIPKNAPKCKVQNVIRYGGQVIWSEPTMQSRERTAAEVLRETGAALIHPYNDGRIIRPIVRDLVDDIITVEDEEIVEAMRLCYEILKVAVEPSGAIGLAAVLSDSFQKNPAWKDCNHIGIILSGGNVDLGVLWESLLR